MIDNKKIGECIAMLRKERGMTGEKFAELLDVSPQAVFRHRQFPNGKPERISRKLSCYRLFQNY